MNKMELIIGIVLFVYALGLNFVYPSSYKAFFYGMLIAGVVIAIIGLVADK